MVESNDHQSAKLMTLEELNFKASYEDGIIYGKVEIVEGTVIWTEREIYNKLIKEYESHYNYEFLELNVRNVDIDNLPDYLARYIYRIYLLEDMTTSMKRIEN